MALPAWLASTVHVPALTKVMLAPFVPPEVHTEAVAVVNVTANPDEAVALTVTGDLVFVPGFANVIVWLAFDTVKLWLTSGAAL